MSFSVHNLFIGRCHAFWSIQLIWKTLSLLRLWIRQWELRCRNVFNFTRHQSLASLHSYSATNNQGYLGKFLRARGKYFLKNSLCCFVQEREYPLSLSLCIYNVTSKKAGNDQAKGSDNSIVRPSRPHLAAWKADGTPLQGLNVEGRISNPKRSGQI